MGVDVLSIDGFECMWQYLLADFSSLLGPYTGAGHPGEEDMGGLILVRTQNHTVFLDTGSPTHVAAC